MERSLAAQLLGNLHEEESKGDVSNHAHDDLSPILDKIDEDDEDEVQEEANKYIKYAIDGKSVELSGPTQRGVLRIRNPKVPISSNALRFQELMHIENTIVGMQAMPDFGYDGDNFVIERDAEAPRNWKLLTDFVYNKDKYEWL